MALAFDFRAIAGRGVGIKGSGSVDDQVRPTLLSTSDEAFVVLAIRLVCLGLIAYWAFILIRPFLTILIWSAIIAVALYPIFEWLSAKFLGHRALAATVITLCSLFVMLGPATWLGLSLADSARLLSARLSDGTIAIPAPPETVKTWPVIGNNAYEIWQLASTNLRQVLVGAAPQLKPLGAGVLAAAGSVGINLLKFIIATIISGFLFIPGPRLVHSVKNLFQHLAAKRGEMFVDVTGATIRNISRGVIGIAVVQALLAGVGLIVSGVPAAGLISFVVLLLAIIQIGPAIILIPVIVWSWFAMDTAMAALFSVYMILVGLLDNVLRPLVMAKGLGTPMPVILVGVFGGTLAHGMIGLFVGPIVLSIAWQLLALWFRDESSKQDLLAH
ncbi:MAG: AI-2E family transporter [Rhizobiales bacterium]|nr:AI-2E family transporter [Hyphomicrobiales bacterium]